MLLSGLRRRSQWQTLCGATVIAAMAACDAPLSRDECDRLLDRYTELLLKTDRPKLSIAEQVRILEDTRAKAANDPAFARCSRRVSRRAFECAMQAQNPDELERCLL